MLPALLAVALMGLASLVQRKPKDRSFASDSRGNINLGILGVIVALIGGMVVFLVLSDMAEPFLGALGSFLTALVDVEIGDSSAANITETIISSLAILVGVGAALFLVGYGLRAAGVGRKG